LTERGRKVPVSKILRFLFFIQFSYSFFLFLAKCSSIWVIDGSLKNCYFFSKRGQNFEISHIWKVYTSFIYHPI